MYLGELIVFLGFGGLGAILGLAVGYSLGRRPGRVVVAAGVVIVPAVAVALWLYERSLVADSDEGEYAGLFELILAVALGANAVAWLVGLAVGAGARAFVMRRRRGDTAMN